MPLVSFYTPWKHQKTWFCDVFRECGKRPVTWDELRKYLWLNSAAIQSSTALKFLDFSVFLSNYLGTSVYDCFKEEAAFTF